MSSLCLPRPPAEYLPDEYLQAGLQAGSLRLVRYQTSVDRLRRLIKVYDFVLDNCSAFPPFSIDHLPALTVRQAEYLRWSCEPFSYLKPLRKSSLENRAEPI